MNETSNILDFYTYNPKNAFYLDKHFTSSGILGVYSPNSKDVFLVEPDGKSFNGTVDPYNKYEINSLGLRGKVDENAEILVSGCSVTFGIGVPESARWTDLLSKKTNKSVMNIGNPGASVQTICNDIIRYCMNNKMPKEIFCLMPDFFRSMVVVDKEFYKSKVDRNLGQINGLQLMFCGPKVISYDEETAFMVEMKDQKYIEDSISPHQLIFNSINSLYILESFCLSNNIKLHWTTLHTTSFLIMKKLMKVKNFKLKNYSPLLLKDKPESPNLYIKDICNSDHDSEFKDSPCWHEGSDYVVVDYKRKPYSAHPGIHFHHHVADFFYDLHKKNNTET
jgi:hypothetical protein